MAHFHSRQKKMTEEEECAILSSVYPTLPRPKPKAKEHGYQKRHDLLRTGFGDPLSNNTHTCDQSHDSYLTKDEFVQRFKPFYDRTGAIVPPVHTRPRTPDKFIAEGTPAASLIKTCNGVTARHNVFYDVRTGEIVLVVVANSEADRFYTGYYEGKTTFPHISKMRGEEVKERLNSSPMMLVINNEPVFWGYAHELAAMNQNNPTFAALLKNAKHWWMQYQEPTITNPVARPVWDMPRLRFVQMQESTIKRIVKQ